MWPTRTSSGAAPTGPRRRHGVGDVVACRRADARAGALPHPADPLHAIRPTRGDRVGALHRLDLRRAKGPPASNWSTFAYSSSVSSGRLASSLASGARLFRLAWPAARNRSRHCEARAADPQLPRHRQTTVPPGRARRRLRSPSGLPPPPPIPDRRHASCEYSSLQEVVPTGPETQMLYVCR